MLITVGVAGTKLQLNSCTSEVQDDKVAVPPRPASAKVYTSTMNIVN